MTRPLAGQRTGPNARPAWTRLALGVAMAFALHICPHAAEAAAESKPPGTATAPPATPATPAPHWAARAAPADLPPNAVARALIDGDPTVEQARHAVEAARHRGAMLDAGPYEWTAKAMAQRRSYRSGDPVTSDWSAGVERTLRSGTKAALDRLSGQALLRQAQARLGEARHEAARSLLTLWLNWVASERTRALWDEQLGLAATHLQAATQRRKAGDASMLEQNAAQADQAEVQRQLSLAANEVAKARARLRARFPTLLLSAPQLGDPQPVVPDAAQWRERILAESDSLRIAEQAFRRAALAADRARADRSPDPTVGLHAGLDGSRAERVIGLSLSIPFGASYRDEQAGEAMRQADAAGSAVQAHQRELEAEIAEALADADGSLERWKFAEAATAATRENARLTQRAYALGEADLQALLLARRQSVEALLGAALARADALRARYRLLVDARLIWDLADD